MPRLVWDDTGSRFYETGVKQGVLYPQDTSGVYPIGVAWNGLTGVTEKPSGAEATALYADDTKYLNLISAEEFGCTIEAYTYPEEFAECNGEYEVSPGVSIGQQKRKPFGLCYRTTLGNDIQNDDYGHKIHIVYGGMASPSEKAFATINDSPEAITFSWEVTTTPVNITGFKPTASLTIDSTKVPSAKLSQLEDILYGGAYALLDSKPDGWDTDCTKYFKRKTGSQTEFESVATGTTWASGTYYTTSGPRLPLPDEIASIVGNSAISQ